MARSFFGSDTVDVSGSDFVSTIRVSQYVYFFVSSAEVTAAQMAAAIGMPPDRETIKGSQDPGRPRPLEHSWVLECRDSVPSHEQVARLLRRVRVIAPSLETLRNLNVSMGVQLVGEFATDAEHEADGQLSWWFDSADVELLGRLGASIVADECAG